MSKEAIIVAIGKEEGKLKRQQENHESTKALMAIVGESAKEIAKAERQEAAMRETEANIAALKKALAKAK